MGKRLFVFGFLLLFFNVSFAQSQYRLGFLGGINSAGYSSISGIQMNSKIAFLGGLSTEIKLKDKLFLATDLYFERKRAESNRDWQDFNTGRDLYLIAQNDYLVLPIRLKYDFKKMDAFYVTGGVYVAYLVNSYFYDGFGSEEYSNRFEKLDYGACVGIGKAFNITPDSRITLELRGSLGLADVSAHGYFGGRSINTKSLSLICGYSFDL